MRPSALLLALLALLAVALAVDVFTVAVVAGIGNAQKVPGDAPGFQFIQYCSGTTQWPCNNEPGLCTENCGTPNANGPQCLCPSIPTGQTLDLAQFPVQLRWGDPVPANVPGFTGTGVKSGFGFKPIVTQQVPATSGEFLVGTAVHFNQPIWQRGSSCGGWDLKLQITVTPAAGGLPITGQWSYELHLDETNNNCTSFFGSTGCWTAPFWGANDMAIEWPACNKDSEGQPRSPDNNYCCRYKTTNNIACADKVWTLDTVDLAAPPILIDGIEYTLWLNGFSVPGQAGVRKSFFISQETMNTQADIYGRLVKACPPASECPVPPVLSTDGSACVCPITLPPPPTTLPPPTTAPPLQELTGVPLPTPSANPTTGETINPEIGVTITGDSITTTGFTLPPPIPTETQNNTNVTAGAQSRGPGRNQMSKAAVAGIVVGAIVAAIIILALGIFLYAKAAGTPVPGGALLGAGEVGAASDNPLWMSPTTSHNNPTYYQSM